jgi:hypothetical protein
MGDGGQVNNTVVKFEAVSMSFQCPFSTLSMEVVVNVIQLNL